MGAMLGGRRQEKDKDYLSAFKQATSESILFL